MTMGITSPTSTTGQILKNGSAVISFDANNNATFSGNVAPSVNPTMRNRIINGAMVFAQRATTASNVGSSAYATLDRFVLDTRINASPTGSYTQAQSTDAPAGFNYSFSVTVSTAGNSLASAFGLNLAHFIEGYNVADLNWGTANAQTITLSFWVKSSITGSYGFGVVNASYGASYVGQYTVNSANTWEKKTITITGATIGTWDSTTGRGIQLKFSLGTGSGAVTATPNTWVVGEYYDASSSTASPTFWSTTGAVWKITGVQLEVGSVATPFEQRLYGTELALCQRYYEIIKNDSGGMSYCNLACSVANTTLRGDLKYSTIKRTNPSITFSAGSTFYVQGNNFNVTPSSLTTGATAGLQSVLVDVSSGTVTQGYAYYLIAQGASSSIQISAEL